MENETGVLSSCSSVKGWNRSENTQCRRPEIVIPQFAEPSTSWMTFINQQMGDAACENTEHRLLNDISKEKLWEEAFAFMLGDAGPDIDKNDSITTTNLSLGSCNSAQSKKSCEGFHTTNANSKFCENDLFQGKHHKCCFILL